MKCIYNLLYFELTSFERGVVCKKLVSFVDCKGNHNQWNKIFYIIILLYLSYHCPYEKKNY